MTPWATARRLSRRWGFALFLLALVVVFRGVALRFLLGAMLAYVLAPAVARLSGRVPRFVAVLVLYVGMLGALALFLGAFLPRLSGDLSRLLREAPVFFGRVKSEYVPRASGWIERNFPSDETQSAARAADGPRPERKLSVVETRPGRYDISLESLDLEVQSTGKGRYQIGPRREEPTDRLTDLMANLARTTESETMDLLKLGQRFVSSVVKGLVSFILVFMVAGFLLVDERRVMAFLRSLVPAEQRASYDGLLREMDRGLSGVIRGQLLICLVNGGLTYAGLLLLHVKYGLLLALLAAGMSLIPVFGSILSSIPIVAVALIAGGALDLKRGLGMLAWIVAIHLFEANFLNPKIIGGAARIHPIVVIFALLVGEESGGLLGALVAVPAASMIQTLFLYFRRRSDQRVETT